MIINNSIYLWNLRLHDYEKPELQFCLKTTLFPKIFTTQQVFKQICFFCKKNRFKILHQWRKISNPTKTVINTFFHVNYNVSQTKAIYQLIFSKIAQVIILSVTYPLVVSRSFLKDVKVHNSILIVLNRINNKSFFLLVLPTFHLSRKVY
jgi:hypothetical protein